jgi:hypothetical protein
VKLYRAKIPAIARDILERLVRDEMIEINGSMRAEAEADLVAIMEEYLRRDQTFREHVKDYMAGRSIPYDQAGRTRQKLAENLGHPLGEDVERFLCRQFIENLMISRFVDEVFAEDQDMYPKVMEALREHDVDEDALRREAEDKIKNVAAGTVEYEIALQGAMRDVKKRKGLLA